MDATLPTRPGRAGYPRMTPTCGSFGAVAVLEDMATGARHWLSPRHLLGRAPNCQLRIREPRVSGFHAELLWDGRSWRLQDLGSRNGTTLGERRLAVGEQVELTRGAELTLAGRVSFRLVDDSAPSLIATSPDGETRTAEDGLLVLPSEESPELTLYMELDGRWVVESSSGSAELEGEQTLFAGGKPWRVSLPNTLPETREIDNERRIHAFSHRFFVSRDGEHIELSLVSPAGNESVRIEPRAHLALLLVLARVRLEDAEAGLPESEHGWVHREDLPRKLGVEPHLPNLWIHRARKQLAKLGFRDAATVIERRANGTQLRLSVRRIEIADA